MELVIINNKQDVEYLIKKGFNFFNKILITTDIETTYKYSDKFEIINLWKFLDDDLIEKCEKISDNLINNLIIPERYSIYFGSTDIVDITKIYLKTFFKALLHTEVSLNKLKKDNTIDKIYIPKENKRLLSESYIFSDILINSVRNIFKGFYKYYNTDPLIYKRQQIKKYEIDTKEYLFDIMESAQYAGNNLLMILSENFEWDFDLYKYFIKRHKNINIVLRTYTRNTTEIKGNTPLFFNDFKFETDESIEIKAKIKTTADYFIKNLLQIFPDLSDIISNSTFDYQFEDFFNRLADYADNLMALRRIIDFLSPDKIYFSNSWDMSVRCMSEYAMHKNIETSLTIHGGIIDNSGYKSRLAKANNYFVWGKDNYEGLAKYGYNINSIKIVGSMQMDYWRAKVKTFEEKGEIKEANEYKNIYNFTAKKESKNKFTITFFTSDGGGFGGHSVKENEHIESLKRIIKYANRNPKFDICLKPHVLYDYFDFWEDVKKDLPDNFIILKEQNLLQACEDMDIGVLLNTMSNVAYEIAIYGKPFVLFKDAAFNCECGKSTIERGGIDVFNNFNDFTLYIDSYYNNKDNTKDNADKKRIEFLKLSLADDKLTVAERIEEILFSNNNKSNSGIINKDIYNIIEWVKNAIMNKSVSSFPDISDGDNIPRGDELAKWVYRLLNEWNLYYKKDEISDDLYIKLLKKIPNEYIINKNVIIRRTIYSKSRKVYLKLNLNKNNKIRKAIKKFI